MRRTVLTLTTSENISFTNSYIYRTSDSNGGYTITTTPNTSSSYKYNDINKYIRDNKYQEMPETMTWNSITTNDGLVVAYSGNTVVIYDLFPNNNLTPTDIDAIKMQNSIAKLKNLSIFLLFSQLTGIILPLSRPNFKEIF